MLNSEVVGFESFDFSTLYTSIPHDSLKSTLEKLVGEVFKTRGALRLCVNGKNKCFWSSKLVLQCMIKERVLTFI